MKRQVVDIKLTPGSAPGSFQQQARLDGEEKGDFARPCDVPHPLDGLGLEEAGAGGGTMRGIVYRRATGADGTAAPVEIVSLDTLTRVGQRLFDDWLSEPLKAHILEHAGEGGIELRFDLTDCPTVADTPFELLALPDENGASFLANLKATRISRYFAPRKAPGAAAPAKLDRVAHALFLGANPHPDRPLDIAAEVEAVTGLSLSEVPEESDTVVDVPLADGALIKWTVIPKASAKGVVEQLGKPDWDIVHFVGHGGFDADEGRHFIEVHHRNPARPQRIYEKEFRQAMENALPSLVFLNACGTGQTELAGYFRGVARELVSARVAYVVAMRDEVPDTVARQFAKRFYEALVEADPATGGTRNGPTEAASLARNAVFAAIDQPEWFRLSFSIPVIYSSLPHGQLGPLLSLPIAAAAVAPEGDAKGGASPGGGAGGWAWIGQNSRQLMVLIGAAGLVVALAFGVLNLSDEMPPGDMAEIAEEALPEAPGPSRDGAVPGQHGSRGPAGREDIEEEGYAESGGYYPEDGYDDGYGLSYSEDPRAEDFLALCPEGDETCDTGRLEDRATDSREIGFEAPNPPPPPPPPPLLPPPSIAIACPDLVINFADNADTPDVTRSAFKQLARQLDACDAARVMVTGHADRVLDDAASLALSRKRAERIKAELRALLPDPEIYTLPRGESWPLVPTPDGVREPLNNRVEIESVERVPAGIDAVQVAFEAARSAYRQRLRLIEAQVAENSPAREDVPIRFRSWFDRLAAELARAEALLRSERANAREDKAFFEAGKVRLDAQLAALARARADVAEVTGAIEAQQTALSDLIEEIRRADAFAAGGPGGVPTVTAAERQAFSSARSRAEEARDDAFATEDWTTGDFRNSADVLTRARIDLVDAGEVLREKRQTYQRQLYADLDAIREALGLHPGLAVEVTSPFRHPDDVSLALCDGLIMRDGLYNSLRYHLTDDDSSPAEDTLAACEGLGSRNPPKVAPEAAPGSDADDAAPITPDRFTVVTPRRDYAIAANGTPGAGSRIELRLRIAAIPQIDYLERDGAIVVPTRQIERLAEWLKAADREAAEKAREDCFGPEECTAMDVPAFAAIMLEMPLDGGEYDPATRQRRYNWLALVAGRLRAAYGGAVRIVPALCDRRWRERGDGEAMAPVSGDRMAISVVPNGVVYILDRCPADGGTD